MAKTLIRLLHFHFVMEGGTQEEASGLLIQVAADVENNFGGQFCPDIADHFVVLVTLTMEQPNPFWGNSVLTIIKLIRWINRK